LDAVRADIYSHKKLNYHYYMALKKSDIKDGEKKTFKGVDGLCPFHHPLLLMGQAGAEKPPARTEATRPQVTSGCSGRMVRRCRKEKQKNQVKSHREAPSD
jgi:hypothetical protein